MRVYWASLQRPVCFFPEYFLVKSSFLSFLKGSGLLYGHYFNRIL